MLKFKANERRLFFWSQESKSDKDDEYVTKINEYINNPSLARNNAAGASDIGNEDDLRNLFHGSDMNAQQLITMLGNVRNISGSGGLASLLGSVSGNSSNRNSSVSSTPAAPQTPTTTPAVASSNATSESSSTTGGTNSPATTGSLMTDLQQIISGLQAGQTPGASSASANSDVSGALLLFYANPLLT